MRPPTVAAPSPPRGPHLLGRRGRVVVLLATSVAAVLLALAGIVHGSVSVPTADVVAVLERRLFGIGPGTDLTTDTIVWEYRFPRMLLAFLVGAGLSLAGLTMQALVRNPLADPYILGVAAGASTAATAGLTLGVGVLAGLSLPLVAFLGAVVALGLVLVLGHRGGRIEPTRMLLAGVALGYLLSAVTSYLQLNATPDQLANVLFWILGSLSGTEWADLPIPAVVTVLAALLLARRATSLDLLALGDDAAGSLGLDLPRFRLQLVLVSALLTAVLVAVAGGIGFVGLMVPHVARLLVGPGHRRLLPLTAVLGGAFLLLVDLLSRVLQAPGEIPVGILTAISGAPFLIWLLRRSRTGGGSL